MCQRERETDRKKERQTVYVCDGVKSRQKVFFACVCVRTCTPACLCVWRPPCQGDSCWQPQVWRFVTQSCSNGQSWTGSEAKWTVFKAEISHHTCLFEHTTVVLPLSREMDNISAKSTKYSLSVWGFNYLLTKHICKEMFVWITQWKSSVMWKDAIAYVSNVLSLGVHRFP